MQFTSPEARRLASASPACPVRLRLRTARWLRGGGGWVKYNSRLPAYLLRHRARALASVL
eukprot:6180569-Pleurochrysis_carterae.AAC.3